jgi:protein TonB
MNIERYKLPAIIAAGLHGALFLCMTETTARPIVLLPKPEPVTYTSFPKDEPVVLPPEDERGGEVNPTPAGAKPLPSAPEVLAPPARDPTFTVPLTNYPPSIDPVKTLGEHRGLPPGPGGGTEGFGPVGIPEAVSLDRIPRAVVQPAPDYPDLLRREGVDGAVTVQFVVDTNGQVMSAEAVKWTHREFVAPAVRAVLRWRFQPGTMDGRKVRFRMAVPIEFNATR